MRDVELAIDSWLESAGEFDLPGAEAAGRGGGWHCLAEPRTAPLLPSFHIPNPPYDNNS